MPKIAGVWYGSQLIEIIHQNEIRREWIGLIKVSEFFTICKADELLKAGKQHCTLKILVMIYISGTAGGCVQQC